MKKNRSTKRTIYILTEGHTEEAYFSRIGEIIGTEDDWKYAVTVQVREIVSGSKTDPINIVKEAKKSKPNYDEIWVVFDKDRQRDDKNEAAFALASKSKIRIAFSSISFEHWLILHFEKNSFAFQRSDCESRSTKSNPIVCTCNGTISAKTYLTSSSLYPTFAKGKSLLYDDIKDRNIIAIENAAWLRSLHTPITALHLLNPYSDVDVLLCELLNLNTVKYVNLNNTFIFEGISITIKKVAKSAQAISISMHLYNNSQHAFPINSNQAFTLIDEQRKEYFYNAIESSVLEPQTTKDLELQFKIDNKLQNVFFKASGVNAYILLAV
jgi:RloB-like protein